MLKKYDVIIIGGSAAGVTAAMTARRYYPEKSLLVIRKNKQVPIPCGIPYVFGTIDGVDKNVIPDSVLVNHKVDLHIGEVQSVNVESKNVVLEGQEFNYDKLILSTGSDPIIPDIKGHQLKHIFPVFKDNAYLAEMLSIVKKAKDIVIVGGGFIGVEFAEECKKSNNATVTLIECQANCLMAAFDDEFCDEARKLLVNQGIQLKTGKRVNAFLGNEYIQEVELEDGERIKADVVILGIGSVSNTKLAKSMNLEIGQSGGIQVNSNMRTSSPDIFACGDCIDAKSFFTEAPCKVKLASTATMQARIAGANLFNLKRTDKGVIGVFSTALSNHAFACAGFTQRDAIKSGYDVVIGVSEGPNRHPAGMPGMQSMKVKLVFNRYDQRIIGGQIFGAYNAGEMINAISSFILSKLTANDIAMFQLGTHPALTASPIAYQLVNAAELANINM